MKFTLRDLFWLTLVIALAAGWFAHSRGLRKEMESKTRLYQNVVAKLTAVNTDLQRAVEAHKALEKTSAWRKKG